ALGGIGNGGANDEIGLGHETILRACVSCFLQGNLTSRARARDCHTFYKHTAEEFASYGGLVLRGMTSKETAMAAQVKPVPDGYHTVTPYIVADGAEK